MSDVADVDLCVVEMRDVTVGSLHRPGVAVLREVNWRVRSGEFWVVAGHHGAGKSDLLMTAAGLIVPLSGECRQFGRDLAGFDDAGTSTRLRLGLVFNGGQLLSGLTLEQNVMLGVRYHENLGLAEPCLRIASLVDAMELGGWLDELPGRVGRQWHQRAGLARALAMSPEVLLVDDPLNGLDALHTRWWLNFLQGLACGAHAFQSYPVTVVLTTDTVGPWCEIASHCALLESGRLLDVGLIRRPGVLSDARMQGYLSHGRWAFDEGR